MNTTFDIARVPFSRRGSRLAIGRIAGMRAKNLGKAPGLFLRTLGGGVALEHREIFRIETLAGHRTCPAREIAQPATLRLEHERGVVEAVFITESRLLLRGRNLGLRLTGDGGSYTTILPSPPDRWDLNLFAQRTQLMLTLRSGSVTVDAPWETDACRHVRIDVQPDASGVWEMEIEEFRSTWTPPERTITFEEAAATSLQDFSTWLARIQPVAKKFSSARELAAYISWSSIVSPRGHLRREAMLMSKNWMLNVWSWDHCFNAIAMAECQPALAWDQWVLPFDHQNPSGALPDCFNDAEMVWNFTKPPIHGWALREMRACGLALNRNQLQQAARWLSKLTEWWLRYRDDDRDGMPNYNHGNDSGWDNATVMGLGPPVEGADLAAFLIVQMEVLAELCKELGKRKETMLWKSRSDALFLRLLEHSWRGDHFVCPQSGSHLVAPGDSLVPFMPLLLGKRLPASIRNVLTRGLKRFVTPHGLATECPRSPLYSPDGYWRGPIWAPSTLLIVSGLRACGERILASRIARAFCQTCAKSGFAENFDALSGDGLRDPAYTWTSSVFLILASQPRRPARH